MLQETIDLLASIKEQSVYVNFNPSVFDFTDKEAQNEVEIFIQDGRSIKIILTEENLFFIISILKMSLFAKGMKILVWDWKNFASYILAKTGKDFVVAGSIIDIKILESYIGRKFKAPTSINEALSRLKDLVSSGLWKEIEPIYKNIHIPLSTFVIPHLENSGIISVLKASRVFTHYEIDGQENGRLRCCNAFKNGYVSHAMSQEVKSNLKPRSLDELFMLFDFRAMEVFMLAWLSKDPLLQEMCESSDTYCSLYEKLLQKTPDKKSDRELIKKIFLPVIYGQSPRMLGQRCNIPKDDAISIVNRIHTLFSGAIKWVESQEQHLKELGYAKDIFGKRRTFPEGKEYLVRNFSIQSPSAIVCLEKLNHLYFALRDKTDLAFTVHDGYAIYFKKDNWKEVYKISNDVLSGPSEFCPGLRLKVSCRVGKNLNQLKTLQKSNKEN